MRNMKLTKTARELDFFRFVFCFIFESEKRQSLCIIELLGKPDISGMRN